MSTYRLNRLFAPRTVAVIGGSPRATSPGRAVLKNLHGGGFPGAIQLVNPHYDSIEGVAAVKTCAALAPTPDVVVIAVPPPAVRGVVRDAAAKGAAAAIILTAGLGHGAGSLAAAGAAAVSLETPIGEEDDSHLGDLIEDKNAIQPIDAMIQSNLRETTTHVLASLTPREERIVRMRFGLGMNSDHTLEEVGQQFSVTRERIRQIEAKAIRKLKHPSRSRVLRTFLDN